jgi:hypothetical protein
MKIAVLMWYDDKIKYYADNFYKINAAYCEKYNYTLIKSSTRRCKGREPHWERFPLILKHIKDYDYVVWIDADAWFYADAPPLEDIIKKYNKEILFSAERLISRPPPVINSGVIICKNTQRVIDTINKWAYSEDLKDKYSEVCSGTWIEDQGVVRGCFRDNVDGLRDISVIIPYLELQHHKQSERGDNGCWRRVNDNGDISWILSIPYVFHLAGQDSHERENLSTRYLKTLNLDHRRHQRDQDQDQDQE